MPSHSRIRSFQAALAAMMIATGTETAGAQADALRLHRLFQDGMVLQRDVPVPVWGWTAPGTAVFVTLAGHAARATADDVGAWDVRLPALTAGGPHALAVEAGGMRVDVRDVLVGDVWVASGQSNMEWPLAQTTNGAAAVAAAWDPQVREFAVPHTWSHAPEADLAGGRWAAADPEHAARFSAVGWFFARDLRAATGVSIGIIHTSWSGANIETWMSRGALGMSDEEWAALVQAERDRDAALRDTLAARLGGTLPGTDAGLAGGRAVWADPALDDSGWETLPVPSYWEQAGWAGLDGSAWYRTTFTLTEGEARQDSRLSLGMIDDDDVTWVNGTEIGRTTGYSRPRVYTVPSSALRAGTNVLAVRVGDGAGNGGPWGEPAAYFVETSGARKPLAGGWKFRVGSVSLQPDGQRINKVPTVLYNRMIHPLLRYPVRGVIWYQGESNANSDAQAAAYRPLFAELIRNWRREWTGGADLPFLWVQLPNFGAVDTVPPSSAGWALLREAQAAALSSPNTGQVVAIDLGDPADIHPRDKEPVGRRLAHVARRVAYGEDVPASGPVYRRHTIRDGRVMIEFDDGGAGLVSRALGGQVGGVAVAGEDRRWVWAHARLEDGLVVAWSPEVPEPVAVRYLWSNSPAAPDLFDGDGLPAAPFRTDTW